MNLMLNFLKNLFRSSRTYYTGANIDPRLAQQTMADWTHEELGTATVFSYLTTKPQPVFPYEDQQGTNECGPHAATLAMGANEVRSGQAFARLSKDFFYRLRSNFPTAGMYLKELGSVASGSGSCLQTTVPTSSSDDFANLLVLTDQMKAEAAIYRQGHYFQINNYEDIDALAELINGENTAVVLFIYATYREWAQEYPVILDNPSVSVAPIRHFVCAVPQGAYMEGDTRYLTIQDSAHFGGQVIRRLSADFIANRCIGALYFRDLILTPHQTPKPIWPRAAGSLTMYDRGAEVRTLQQILIYEGLLPQGCDTGSFLGMTLAGVKAYQAKYASDILAPNGITAPTGFVGQATLAHLSAHYG